MTPLKLVNEAGDILGAILMPDEAAERLHIHKQLNIYIPPDVGLNFRGALSDTAVKLNEIIIIPAPMRPDAVMIVVGTLFDFEKCRDCFFIPGYAFSQKGRL